MADTGFKVTGAVVSNAWGQIPVTTTRINTSDNSRAETTLNNNSYEVATLNNYTFGVPSGATIDGIELVAEFSDFDASTEAYVRCSLSWNNETNYTATKEDYVVGSTDATKTYGGPADTWGHAFTVAELADGTFLVKLEGRTGGTFGDRYCRLDYLAIKVYYTPSGGAPDTSKFFIMF